VDRLDPRTKILAVALIAVGVLTSSSYTSVLLWGIIPCAALAVLQVAWRNVTRIVLSVLWFAAFIIGLNAFNTSGRVVLDLFGATATLEGIEKGALLSSRILILALASLSLVKSTPVTDVVAAIEHSLRPFRKWLGGFTQLLSLTLTFVPLMISTARRIKTAQIARGADVDSSIGRQIRFAFSAAIPLFAGTFRASEQLALAMEARCYDPSAARSSFVRLRMRWIDWMVLFVLFSGVAFL
jgi:energy-coupling factor transport system permease protein